MNECSKVEILSESGLIRQINPNIKFVFLTYMTGINENGIKHCYRADKRNTLLEPSLKVLVIKFGWGLYLENVGFLQKL